MGSEEGPSPSLLVAETVVLITTDELQMKEGKSTTNSQLSSSQAVLVTDKPELKRVS